jgi:nucleoside 2-deoxyribosyltransferase
MKVFISYRYTGEDLIELKGVIDSICSSLKDAGHDSFCSFDKNTFFAENNFSYKQILEYALKELDASDCVLVLVKSPEKSEGMLLEVGYALAKGKKIILAIREGITATFLPEIASHVLIFSQLDELYDQLKTVRF